MRNALTAAAVLTFAVVLVACNGDSPTGPSPVPDAAVSPSGGQVASGTTAPAPVADATPDPNQNQGPWQEHVSFDDHGNLTINVPGTTAYDGQYCYFINGPHPQDRLFVANAKVQAGHSKTFSVPDLASMIEAPEGCEVRTEIQADAGAFSFDCDNPSNQLADAGTSDLHAYKYFEVVTNPGGEGEWEMVGKPEQSEITWGECQEPTGPTASTDVESQCMRQGEYTITTTYKHTCTGEVRVDTETKYTSEPCECPCVEEWIEEEPVIEEGEWGECVAPEDVDEQAFADFIASTNSPPEKCYGEHSRTVTYTWYEVNSCTQERRYSRTRKEIRTEKCEVECPYAEGYCFYNISRQPKQFTCEVKLGGNPLRFGEWGRWPDGPPSDHCRFTVPGIYSDLGRRFQLTPGQSDPRCNSY